MVRFHSITQKGGACGVSKNLLSPPLSSFRCQKSFSPSSLPGRGRNSRIQEPKESGNPRQNHSLRHVILEFFEFLNSWIPLSLLHFCDFLLYLLRSRVVAPLAHFVANLLELLADTLQILLVGPAKLLKLVFGKSGSALSDLLQLSQDFFGLFTV